MLDSVNLVRKKRAMFDPKKAEELKAYLNAMLEKSPLADIEKNIRTLPASFFSKLDLISREEYEIQAEMLRHVQESLAQLEKRVSRLEGAQEASPVMDNARGGTCAKLGGAKSSPVPASRNRRKKTETTQEAGE